MPCDGGGYRVRRTGRSMLSGLPDNLVSIQAFSSSHGKRTHHPHLLHGIANWHLDVVWHNIPLASPNLWPSSIAFLMAASPVRDVKLNRRVRWFVFAEWYLPQVFPSGKNRRTVFRNDMAKRSCMSASKEWSSGHEVLKSLRYTKRIKGPTISCRFIVAELRVL